MLAPWPIGDKRTCRSDLCNNAFEGSKDRVLRRQLSDEALAMGIPEIAHESATRDGGVRLEDGREKKIRNRKRPSPRPGAYGFVNASAEILEQDLEVVFFVGLGGVVSRPALTQKGCAF